MKAFLKRFVPPILLDAFRNKAEYGFLGDYPSWEAAVKDSRGYDSPVILEKVKAALLKVKSGEAAYERDSVLFDKKQYSWPVLAALLWIGSKNSDKLSVLDFGGSLGSSYFQNREFLRHFKLSWNVVEQKNFVAAGKESFEDDTLAFFDSVEKCEQSRKSDVFLALSSLQYLEDPYSFLEEIAGKNFPYIVLDRTPFLPNAERITVQKIRPGIYDASYPARLINEEKFKNIFSENYEIIASFDEPFGKIALKGFILKRNNL